LKVKKRVELEHVGVRAADHIDLLADSLDFAEDTYEELTDQRDMLLKSYISS